MQRPDIALVAQQIEAQRQAQVAEFNALSHLKKLAAVASYRAAQKRGDEVFHPYHGAISGFAAPFQAAA
jgi:hypothetical protein